MRTSISPSSAHVLDRVGDQLGDEQAGVVEHRLGDLVAQRDRAARARARRKRVTSGAFPSRTWAVRRVPAVPAYSHASIYRRAPAVQRHRPRSSCAASWTWRPGPRAEEELRRAEDERPPVLVLDLREVTFFDSTGLQLVLDADVRAREEGRTFIVRAGRRRAAARPRAGRGGRPAQPGGVGGWSCAAATALDGAGDGFVLTDPRLDDTRSSTPTRRSSTMTGYPADEVLGRNCRFLQGEDTDAPRSRSCAGRSPTAPGDRRAAQLPQDGSAVLERGPHRAGARRAREVVRFVGVQVDVTARRASARVARAPLDVPGRRRPAARRLARSASRRSTR